MPNVVSILLPQCIDYAGLFPPAGLPLDTVVENYAKYRQQSQQWMLARFIVPARRLPELQTVVGENHRIKFPVPWQVSALIPPISDDTFTDAVQSIHDFNASQNWAVVDAVEGKLTTAADVRPTLASIPADWGTFLEIHPTEFDELIPLLAKQAAGKTTFAKIRTGGVTPDLIPETHVVAKFLDLCATHRLGFKATAGLHHPMRAEHPLTYESDSVRGWMHGFLNVFLAAAFAWNHHSGPETLAALLDETDHEAFQISDNGIRWRDANLTLEQLVACREDFAQSFGSCSFTEPVEDLARMGWLQPATSPH